MKTCKTIVIRGKRYKLMHGKTYSGYIKYTKGLQNLNDPRIKPMTHRIVRSKSKREIMTEINENSIEDAIDGLVEQKMGECGVDRIRSIRGDEFIMTCEICGLKFSTGIGHMCKGEKAELNDEI